MPKRVEDCKSFLGFADVLRWEWKEFQPYLDVPLEVSKWLGNGL